MLPLRELNKFPLKLMHKEVFSKTWEAIKIKETWHNSTLLHAKSSRGIRVFRKLSYRVIEENCRRILI